MLALVPSDTPRPKRTYTAEQRRRWRSAEKARYANDPEHKAKVLAQAKAWREAHPELKKQRSREWQAKKREQMRADGTWKEHVRAENLKKLFGITIADYERMLVEQNGVCAICCRKCKTGKRLAVDHDHATGEVRGLLCTNCNQGLGKYRDDPLLLRTAASYLERNK